MDYTTGMPGTPASSESIILGLVRAAERRESIDGPEGRQGRASVVEKFKVYVRSTKVCVSSNTILLIQPRDGTLQELRLLVLGTLRLKLCEGSRSAGPASDWAHRRL